MGKARIDRHRVKPFATLEHHALARVRVVLFDIDDTFSTDGRITDHAFHALWQLHAADIAAIPVTGRPAGWCDMIARFWPVDAVVGENGAFWFRYDRHARRMQRHYVLDAATRGAQRERLAAIGARVLREVPAAAIAADQAYRETDLAIDFCEDVAPLPAQAVERICVIMREAGLTAKVSSIHVNGWFGGYDKLTTSRALLAEQFAIEHIAGGEAMFIGDSPNDAPMFAACALSVGVANVRRFVDAMEHAPAYVTEHEAGEGFAEVVAALVASRTRRSP